MTPSREVTLEGKKLWANLQRIVEKRGRTGKKVWGDTLERGDIRVKAIKSDKAMSKKVVSFAKKKSEVTPQNWQLKNCRFFSNIYRGDTLSCRSGCHPP